ncbi:MAG: S9 family peptidase [Bacteroidaceae bacterium]|nr:S9 family peptidase [Bacteroidaceae bacterium]MDO4956414.1 S9 family peptidase [Bacteroidales bacterium]
MKKLISLILLCMFSLNLQAKNVLTMEDITRGSFRAQAVYGWTPSKDGESFTQISADRQRIVRNSFKTGEEIETVFDVNTARNVKLDYIDGYIMSPAEDNILIQTETQSIYRHSYTAVFYIYNVRNKTLVPLSENGPQQVPLFSPDGTMVAFVRNNNLFLVKLLYNNAESQVTKDGKYNEILNGIPDWVNEEEFGYSRAFDFSADSQMLAWIRFDESQVPEFNFSLYKGAAPAYTDYALYPGAYSYKYPVAGVDNAKVKVMTFDIKSRATRTIDLPLEADGYIPRIYFTKDPDKLAVMTLNRHQNRYDIYMANPRSCTAQLIVRDEAPQYIKEPAYDDIRFYDKNFVMMSERDGYNHLYLYNFNGQLIKQITKGEFEVTAFYGWDEATNTFYYGSNEGSPLRKNVYKIDGKGRKTRLTSKDGTNSALFSANMKYFLNNWSDANTPYVFTLNDNNGKTLKTLVDNQRLNDKLAQTELGTKEFFTFTTSEGVQLNGFMIKPANFDASKKYPVVMHQYSGPGSQQVTDSWGIGANGNGGLFESFLCSEGFICVCVDGRGTGGRGAEFEKCTYLNLGVKESKDQVETAIYLGTLPYIDKNNIAIWGWSYGGFNTLMSMSEGRPVFKCGVAVAPPTSWRYYDTIYTERFMRTPQENSKGYDECPISRAKNLSGNLLLCHGLADDNVHFRNSAEYSESLVQADKQFEMQVYTNRNHGIGGGNTRHHLYTRINNFFVSNLMKK